MNDFVPPVDRALLAAVARRYFVHDETKVQIARDLGVSRFKVARLLDQARDEGVVRIEIEDVSDIDLELARRLQQALPLRHAVVLSGSIDMDPAVLIRAVSRLAATELSRTAGPDDVLGLPWSRKVGLTVAALTALPKIPVVQLTGALTAVDHDSPVDIVRDAARIGGGHAHHFYAPLVASDAESAATFRRQPSVAAALAHAGDVTLAVVGIGAWARGRSTLFDWADAGEHDQLARAGVVGEVSGVFLDENGSEVVSDLARRVITVTADQLRRIPRVIGVVVGADQADAVLAAHRAGIVDVLVMDDQLAKRLLERLEREPARLFHLALASDWERAQATGSYTTSTRGRTLEQEGFIHLSYAHQWPRTRERFYADVAEPLVLLTVDPSGLDVREEVGDPASGEKFPHLYGPLPVTAVTRAERLDPDAD